MPPAMQAKLLRVLQEQELERIGDTHTRKVNVRVIAATNRNLTSEVDAGRFRQICSIVCEFFRSRFQRCVSAPKTSLHLPPTSSGRSPIA